MIKIKSKDNKYFEIDKEKLIEIEYFKIYFSDSFNDDKKTIDLDYNNNIIEYLNNSLTLSINEKYIRDENSGKYFINKKYIIDKNHLSEYICFLNYIGFDDFIVKLIHRFSHKKYTKYILEIYKLYPQYKKIIQERLYQFYFKYDELIKLENYFQISKCNLYFKISSKSKHIDGIKLFIRLNKINDIHKFNSKCVYGIDYLNYFDRIKEMQKKIIECTNIKFLCYNHNYIQKLPKEFNNLINLQELSFCDNELKVIPDEIYDLTNLKILNLSSNEIMFVSYKIGNLIKLKELYLFHNKITEISNNIGNLVNLQILNL